MATQKKSFVLYCDVIHTVNHLTNEQAGKLFKHLLSYVNGEDPVTHDSTTNLSFEPIKQQLKRDFIKWGNIKEGRSKAGKASAEARKNKKEQELTNPTSVKSAEQSSTNPTVTVNDTVNVNVIDNVTGIKYRKSRFQETLTPFLTKYDPELLNEFFRHWVQINAKGRKMKFEKEDTWDVKARLRKWKENNEKWNKAKPKQANNLTVPDRSEFQKLKDQQS